LELVVDADDAGRLLWVVLISTREGVMERHLSRVAVAYNTIQLK